MSRTIIKFELRGAERELALALQNHVVSVEKLDMDLNTICRNQFLNWMTRSVKEAQDAIAAQGDSTGDVTEDPVPSNSNELEAASEAGADPGNQLPG